MRHQRSLAFTWQVEEVLLTTPVFALDHQGSLLTVIGCAVGQRFLSSILHLRQKHYLINRAVDAGYLQQRLITIGTGRQLDL